MFSLWMYDINKGNRSLGTAFQIFHDIYLTTEKNSKSKLGWMSYLRSLREIQRLFFDHRGVVKLLDIITKAYFRDSQRYIYRFHYKNQKIILFFSLYGAAIHSELLLSWFVFSSHHRPGFSPRIFRTSVMDDSLQLWNTLVISWFNVSLNAFRAHVYTYP